MTFASSCCFCAIAAIGNGLRRLRNALNHAGILLREEALRNDDVEKNRESQRAECDE